MDCFYCNKPAVANCSCSIKQLCEDHMINHNFSHHQNHSFSNFSPGFDPTTIIRKCIIENLNLIKKRKHEVIAETFSLINKIKEKCNQVLIDLAEADKKYLKMFKEIDNADLAQVISDCRPLRVLKKCADSEIENYYSQNFVDKPSLQESWRLFLEKHSTSYAYLCLSDDSKYAFVGGYDHTVRMWNLGNKTLEHTFIGHLNKVSCVAVTRKYLVSGSFDRTIRLWSLADKSLCMILNGHEKGVVCLATIENKWIVSGSLDNSIRVWSIEAQRQEAIFTGHSSVIRKIAVTRDKKSIISCSADNSIIFWNLSSRSKEATLNSKDPLSCITLSQQGDTLYSGSTQGNILKWSVSRKKQILSIKAHDDWIHTLVSTNNDQTLISCSEDKFIKIWNVEGKLIATLKGHSSSVFGLAVTLDQKHIVSSSLDSEIKVWSINKQRQKFTLKLSPICSTSLAVSGSGKFLSYGSGTSVAVWNVLSCEETLLPGHTLAVTCTAISYEGKIVISGSADGFIRLWNMKNPNKNFVHKDQTNDSPCLALTSDRRSAIFGLVDGKVKICLLKKNNKIVELGKHQTSVQCVAVSAKYVVSSSVTNIVVWRLDTRDMFHSFTLSVVNFMELIQISKDEKFIIFDEVFTNLILWNVDSKKVERANITDAIEYYTKNPEFLGTYNFFNKA